MKRQNSDDLVTQFSRFLSLQMGLHFPPERRKDLERGLQSAAQQLGFSNPEDCMEALMSAHLSRQQIEILASHLTVGETYFMRESATLEAFEKQILPELLDRRREARRLRLWSAGCSTGEEAYTIAILLDRVLVNWSAWQVTLLATDINPLALRKAAEGVYRDWSFRGTPEWIKDRYFTKTSEGYAVVPEIRHRVTFAHLNLAEDIYPSLVNNTNAMDVIFCRNVLMYFAPEIAQRVLDQFSHCLVEGGWLIPSASETALMRRSSFALVSFPGALVFRKGPKAARPELVQPAAAAKERISQKRPPARLEVPAPVPPEMPRVQTGPGSNLESATEFYKQGRYPEAAAELSLRLQEHKNDPTAMALLARCHANEGRLDQALQWCERAISQNKTDPSLHFLRASILEEQHRVGEARDSLKLVLYLQPESILAHFAIGNLALHQEDFPEAEKQFQRALALLANRSADEVLPESEGITTGRLKEIIESTLSREALA